MSESDSQLNQFGAAILDLETLHEPFSLRLENRLVSGMEYIGYY